MPEHKFNLSEVPASREFVAQFHTSGDPLYTIPGPGPEAGLVLRVSKVWVTFRPPQNAGYTFAKVKLHGVLDGVDYGPHCPGAPWTVTLDDTSGMNFPGWLLHVVLDAARACV